MLSVGEWRQKLMVDRSSFSYVGSVFHARGAATEKALSPIRRRVRGTTRSPDDESRSADQAGIHRQLVPVSPRCVLAWTSKDNLHNVGLWV